MKGQNTMSKSFSSSDYYWAQSYESSQGCNLARFQAVNYHVKTIFVGVL
jgi:hypothetical protein